MNKKVLKWNFIFQYGYVITNMINSFVLLPFYIHYIDDVQLGLWWATGNILAWLTMSDPGIGDVLQQKIAVLFGKKDFDEVAKTIGSGLIAALCTLVIALIIGICFYFFLDEILNINTQKYHDLKLAFLISIISTGITLVTFALAGINQGLLRSKDVALSYISSNIIFFALNIILLQLGMGLLAIAFGNALRAIYLAVYNTIVIFKTSKKQSQIIVFRIGHFKTFIRIFSYTSLSKIIASISSSFDLIVLARFIPPQMITLFEINRRPIKMLQGLVGRYSVALMPGISHSVGQDKGLVKTNIAKQFNNYLILTFVFACLAILCYEQLIILWIDETKYGGNKIILLLVINFFFSLIGYFMSNMTYALGDIKNNSIINAVKGVILIICIPIGAKINGIEGVLVVTLISTILIEFLYFIFRLSSMGYFNFNKLNSIKWIKLTLVAVIALFSTHIIINASTIHSHFMILISKASIFLSFFFIGIIYLDGSCRSLVFKPRKNNSIN